MEISVLFFDAVFKL